MNLKKLQETAEWNKLDEVTFKERAILLLLKQQHEIAKLSNLTITLTEDIERLKKQLNFINQQSHVIRQKIRSTQPVENIQEKNNVPVKNK